MKGLFNIKNLVKEDLKNLRIKIFHNPKYPNITIILLLTYIDIIYPNVLGSQVPHLGPIAALFSVLTQHI